MGSNPTPAAWLAETRLTKRVSALCVRFQPSLVKPLETARDRSGLAPTGANLAQSVECDPAPRAWWLRRQTGINADDRGAAGAPLLVAATPLAVVADHERARLGRAKVGEHQVAGT